MMGFYVILVKMIEGNIRLKLIPFSTVYPDGLQLKPVDHHEMEQAIEKNRTDKDKTTKEQITQRHLFRAEKIRNIIALSSSQGFFLQRSMICFISRAISAIHLIKNDGKKYPVIRALANFDDILTDDNIFFRVHKSYIINLKFIKQYNRGDGGEILITDRHRLFFSSNKKEGFLKFFTKM
jgi:two-component system LytT family response regulator